MSGVASPVAAALSRPKAMTLHPATMLTENEGHVRCIAKLGRPFGCFAVQRTRSRQPANRKSAIEVDSKSRTVLANRRGPDQKSLNMGRRHVSSGSISTMNEQVAQFERPRDIRPITHYLRATSAHLEQSRPHRARSPYTSDRPYTSRISWRNRRLGVELRNTTAGHTVHSKWAAATSTPTEGSCCRYRRILQSRPSELCPTRNIGLSA